VITQLDTHAHLDVYTSERNDIQASMGKAGNLTMTVDEWIGFSEAMVARFGARKDDEGITFVVVK